MPKFLPFTMSLPKLTVNTETLIINKDMHKEEAIL